MQTALPMPSKTSVSMLQARRITLGFQREFATITLTWRGHARATSVVPKSPECDGMQTTDGGAHFRMLD